MDKEQYVRPQYEMVRARAIKMAKLVERDLQHQRNRVMVGLPVTEALEVLFQNGNIRQRKKLMTPPYEHLIQ